MTKFLDMKHLIDQVIELVLALFQHVNPFLILFSVISPSLSPPGPLLSFISSSYPSLLPPYRSLPCPFPPQWYPFVLFSLFHVFILKSFALLFFSFSFFFTFASRFSKEKCRTAHIHLRSLNFQTVFFLKN